MRGLQGLVALAIDVPAPNFRFGVLRRVANRTNKNNSSSQVAQTSA